MRGLPEIHEDFTDGEMDSVTFSEQLRAHIAESFDAGWTMSVRDQKHPVGTVFGFWPHREDTSPFMIVGEMIWFPWATARNKIESAVNFFNEMRDELPFMEYAEPENKEFFELMCKHSIMHRVGTSYNVFPGERTSVFETKRGR